MLKAVRKFLKNSAGAAILEYALIIALVVIAVIGSLGYLGRRIHEKLSQISSAIGGNEQVTERPERLEESERPEMPEEPERPTTERPPTEESE